MCVGGNRRREEERRRQEQERRRREREAAARRQAEEAHRRQMEIARQQQARMMAEANKVRQPIAAAKAPEALTNRDSGNRVSTRRPDAKETQQQGRKGTGQLRIAIAKPKYTGGVNRNVVG